MKLNRLTGLCVLLLLQYWFLLPSPAQGAPPYAKGAYGFWPARTTLSSSTASCSPTSYSRWLVENKGVVGILLTVQWNEVEPANGQFDWTAVRSRLLEAVACGLRVTLALSTSLQVTPAWLTTRSAATVFSDLGVRLVDLPGYGWVPVFWDQTFNSHRIRFINAAAALLQSLPATVSETVVAISIQPFGAQTMDWNVPHEPSQINAWLQAGYRFRTEGAGPARRMLDAGKLVINAAAAAFPTKNITMSFQVTAEALDGTKIALAQKVLRHGYTRYPGRFHAQLDILKGISPVACAAPCDLDAAGDNNNPRSLFRLLRDYRAAGYNVGIQTAAAVINGAVDDCRQHGVHPCTPCEALDASYAALLSHSVDVGLSYGPTYFEFWQGDARTQTNPGSSCSISTIPEDIGNMREVFRTTTINMGGAPRP